jgi:hypothetical protein
MSGKSDLGSSWLGLERYLPEILAIFISALVGVCYGLMTLQFTDDQFDALTYGLFVSVILSCLTLLIQQVRRVPRIQDLLQRIQLQQTELKRLIDILSSDGDRVHELRTHLSFLKGAIKVVGFDVLDGYIESIKKTEHGFAIEGAFWALRSYEKLWRFIVAEQKRIGNDSDKCLIARITHTNDVNLWIPEKEMRSRVLLRYQREFIEAGGKIVRILIGSAKTIDDPEAEVYRQAKKLMEEQGIEVKYIPKMGEDYSYDFLWIANKGYVVKWYSGVGGQALDKCEILDQVDETIIDMWRSLADRAEHEDSPITSIPKGRTIEYEEVKEIIEQYSQDYSI